MLWVVDVVFAQPVIHSFSDIRGTLWQNLIFVNLT